MKNQVWALLILIVFCFTVNAGAVIKRTLIDFAKYDETIKAQMAEPAESYVTNIDGYPRVVLGYKDYLLENWKVELNESASDIKNRVLSYCKPVASQRFGTTLGVRVHFPSWNNDSYALIKPPFPMNIYDTNGQYANAENGVMPNVSEIKAISIWVNGRNYRFGLAIRLRDRAEVVHEYFVGYLQFDGWRKLTFNNQNFSDNIVSKVLKREPLYPYDVPYMVFDSIVVYRPASEIGGDFVTYIKSIELEYVPYVIDQEVTEDIKDEQVWGIITTRSKTRQGIEERRMTENLYLYQQEKKRMQAQKDEVDTTLGNKSSNTPQATTPAPAQAPAATTTAPKK